ncbi:hypothetical protein HDU93_009747 [Gonapodya sp. JEL0774]|nr:hypothetical protein HDU93_009747 [Gonapodya sp. JEL0774]
MPVEPKDARAEDEETRIPDELWSSEQRGKGKEDAKSDKQDEAQVPDEPWSTEQVDPPQEETPIPDEPRSSEQRGIRKEDPAKSDEQDEAQVHDWSIKVKDEVTEEDIELDIEDLEELLDELNHGGQMGICKL